MFYRMRKVLGSIPSSSILLFFLRSFQPYYLSYLVVWFPFCCYSQDVHAICPSTIVALDRKYCGCEQEFYLPVRYSTRTTIAKASWTLCVRRPVPRV
ncbi:hypothetical protein B0T13DRAFT_461316 [Neurospora crassa]|nr:hypothetical protein B0T13DRAFT_461316 [Neurospora crassa]